ncbi:MAG: radical SAM protein [Methanophagales archaeon ANME-1-THS]|nr:MAG: radical SAM protein [Methanophagales archaeon ANME-1-THS]
MNIKLWGCNWNCKWCPTECCCGLKGVPPVGISIDKLTALLLTLDRDATTMFMISGGEPLLQKEEVLKLIESFKKNTNYSVMLITNGSLIDANFVEEANALGLDRINISFRSLDDEWHKGYTGHSNRSTIDALKLVSEKFEGLTAVSLIPFSNVDASTFRDTCEFLHGINPEFAIKIYCPFCPDHEREESEKRRYELDEIALQYFKRVDRSVYYSTQYRGIRYQIEEDERGYLALTKTDEWERNKEARTSWLKTS